MNASAQTRTSQRTMTGLVDEQSGPVYVLLNPEDATVLAVLQPANGQPETLAKYVGARVTVRGDLVSTTGTPQLRVQTIAQLVPPPATRGTAERSAPQERNYLSGVVARGPKGGWVLQDPYTKNVIAMLQPVAGVTGTDISKYLHTKVLVQGELRTGTRTPVMTVDGISRFPE